MSLPRFGLVLLLPGDWVWLLLVLVVVEVLALYLAVHLNNLTRGLLNVSLVLDLLIYVLVISCIFLLMKFSSRLLVLLVPGSLEGCLLSVKFDFSLVVLYVTSPCDCGTCSPCISCPG